MCLDRQLMPIVLGFGGAFFRGAKPTATDPKVVSALRFVKDLWDNNQIPRGLDAVTINNLFTQGKIASIISGSFVYFQALKVNWLTLTLDYSHFVARGIEQAAVHPLLPLAGHLHARQAARGRPQAGGDEGIIDFHAIVDRLAGSATGARLRWSTCGVPGRT